MIFRSVYFNVHLLWMEEGVFFGVSPILIKRQIHAPIVLGHSFINADLTPSLVNLCSITLTPYPMLISFGKFDIC